MILIDRDRSRLGLLHTQSHYWTWGSLIIWPALPFSQLGLFVKPQENPNFLKNGKMVISVKIQNFLDLG